MADIFKSKEQEFYIDLKQERYFFPGEDIKGDIVLDLTKSKKINNIKVILDGFVELGGRTISLFSKFVLIAQSPEGGKSHQLEAHTHRFPFMITIPTSKECKVPSSLEITNLVKVSYKITAILNRPTSFFETFSASTNTSITVLEKINVESEEHKGDLHVEKELYLSGSQIPVKVFTVIGKRAAVKGDIIPIFVTIEHIGVMVRDRAISVQLLRSVYYGKNNTELFGPKTLKEVTANIEISGPVNFTKSFPLKLAIPNDTCPTVDKSGQGFKIEYSLRIAVNLNEENPYRKEIPQEVVLFNVPFTVGTCPKLTFNIDDDEDEHGEEYQFSSSQRLDDDIASNHSSEYDQVNEAMKSLDLSLLKSPVIQQATITPLAALSPHASGNTYLPSSRVRPITPDVVNKPDQPSSPSTEVFSQVPMMVSESTSTVTPLESVSSPVENSGGSTSPKNTSHHSELTNTVTPPPEHAAIPPFNLKTNISPSDIYNDYTPGLSPTLSIHRNDSVKSVHTTANTSKADLGRNDSFRWIVRNQEAQSPASPVLSNIGTSLPTSSGLAETFPPRPVPSTSTGFPQPMHGFPPPRPSPSTSNHTNSSFPPQPTPSTSSHTHGGFPPQPTPSTSSHTHGGFPPQPTPSTSSHTHGGFPPQLTQSTSSHTYNGYHPQPTPSLSNSYRTHNGFPAHPTPSISNQTGFYNGFPPHITPNNPYPRPQQGFNYPQQGYSGMPEPQYNNQYNQRPSHAMPVPQFGMGMSSQQSYPPQPSSYPYYHNN